jgi:diadenosine tetraphosphatase ApaH/serine/threonine PP2A family protein phosphatase
MEHLRGPFDIVGDVHGCADELQSLLTLLSYKPDESKVWRHPQGRRAIFVGDLVDRGPGVVQVLQLVMTMVTGGSALCVMGNHEFKLLRKLNGRKVNTANGLSQTLAQLSPESWEFKKELQKFLRQLPSHYLLDDGRLVVAHAGLKESLQGSRSGTAQSFALYGDTTGETDEFGLPVRRDWAQEYRGRAMVVYGHTPVSTPKWLNNTINIDTGCVFGGRLTALRYPERELVFVQAAQVYAKPVRPFLPGSLST